MSRDEFPLEVKRTLSQRVATRCSNPECLIVTAGPQVDPSKALNVGVAAHITGASAEGPRFDSSLEANQRAGIDNGIWLCQTCAKLVDNDPARYPVPLLRQWKAGAEATALAAVGKATPAPVRHPAQAALQEFATALWSVTSYNRTIDDPMYRETGLREHADCRIQEVTPYFVRLLNIAAGVNYTIPLGDITISYDDKRHRPMIQLRALR